MSVVRLFLDTEFTSFNNPRLISFALVAETGEALYLERSEGWTIEDCSAFVREAVLPLLGPLEGRATDSMIRWTIRSWIHSLGRPAMIYTDSLWHDEPAFMSLFTDRMYLWPGGLDQRFVEFNSPAVELAFETKGLRRHHALDDAIALKTAYLLEQEGPGSKALLPGDPDGLLNHTVRAARYSRCASSHSLKAPTRALSVEGMALEYAPLPQEVGS